MNTTEVTDNHGYVYTARILRRGDSYGNGAVWTDDKLGVTIDGNAPGTWYAETIAEGDDGYGISLDFGQDWNLLPGCSDAVRAMCRAALVVRCAECGQPMMSSASGALACPSE